MVTDVTEGQLEVECRFWSPSTRREATHAREGAILLALRRALSDHDLSIAEDELHVRLHRSDDGMP